jgi:hypothetical protein
LQVLNLNGTLTIQDIVTSPRITPPSLRMGMGNFCHNDCMEHLVSQESEGFRQCSHPDEKNGGKLHGTVPKP